MTLQMRRRLESGSRRTTIYRRRRHRDADLHLLLLCNSRLRVTSSDLNRRQEDVFGSDLVRGRRFKFGPGQLSVLNRATFGSSPNTYLSSHLMVMISECLLRIMHMISNFLLMVFMRNNFSEDKIEKVMSGTLRLQTEFGVGAGILYDREGHILTNAHVVVSVEGRLAGQVVANFKGGEQCDAEVLSVDVGNDLALLKIPKSVIEPSNIPCDFSKVVPGMGGKFFVVGHPGGVVPFNVKYGHVSNPSRPPSDIHVNFLNHSYEHMDPAMKFLELDVMAAPGFSGGPLSTIEGLVFGVFHAGIPGTACYGIPFAIIESALGRMLNRSRSPGYDVFCHLN